MHKNNTEKNIAESNKKLSFNLFKEKNAQIHEIEDISEWSSSPEDNYNLDEIKEEDSD